MRAFFRLAVLTILVAIAQIGSFYPAGAQEDQGDYAQAEKVFNSTLTVDQRILFQVLMTASGAWNAVPADRFTRRLFGTVKRFQFENGFAQTGVPDGAFLDRLFLVATPMLDLWGFQWVSHPSRGYKLWIPLGLGMAQSRSEYGLTFDDRKKRAHIDFTTLPSSDIHASFSAFVDTMSSEGTRIHYKVAKDDWFVISFTRADGVDGYVRYYQDGSNVTGFSLYWDNRKGNVNGERVAILMSASLRSSMGGARFIDPPRQSIASPAKSPPQQPIEQPNATPPSREAAPKREEKISSGTGFFVTHDGGLVTNAHVIEGCSRIVVKTEDSSVSEATLIARDSTNDLAILQMRKSTPKKIARLRVAPRLGESVAAFGFPHADMLSSSGNFTLGNITALSGLGDDSRHLQISTPVQSGNSGGPLLDAYGNVVGVVALKLNALKVAAKDGDLPQNVNFAVKSAILAAFLDANRIAFESGAANQKPMEPADLADEARAMSGFVLCN
jgi:serine protease Do